MSDMAILRGTGARLNVEPPKNWEVASDPSWVEALDRCNGRSFSTDFEIELSTHASRPHSLQRKELFSYVRLSVKQVGCALTFHMSLEHWFRDVRDMAAKKRNS